MKTARLPIPPEKMTEADVLAMLRARFTKGGNGGNGEFCFLEHVRNGAAFNANRTLDAVAIALWPSRGLTIDGFEVKVSRSDWQRELAQPDKAEDACKLVDRFSIVAPRGVVLDGELPATWGLLEVVGKRLVTVKAAPLLRPPEPVRLSTISRDFLVGILRSIPEAVPRRVEEGKEVRDAYNRGYATGLRSGLEGGRVLQRAAGRLSDFALKVREECERLEALERLPHRVTQEQVWDEAERLQAEADLLANGEHW